jgi:hypothetical protein
VNRIVRPRLTCACCERFIQAPLPSRPIERGRPGPGLLAHVLVSKYADHLPLYRQSQIFEREGLDLDRSTLADWVGKATALLEPLAEAIGRHVLSAGAIFADDMPISMLAPGSGKTQTARLWTYARDERPWGGTAPPAAWYRFSGDRKGQHPKDHLARFRGWMHADGYAGFEDLYRSGAIREVACMAHVRRKFIDIHRSQASPIAEEAIGRIAKLHAVEKDARGSPPDRRAELRRAHAAPSAAPRPACSRSRLVGGATGRWSCSYSRSASPGMHLYPASCAPTVWPKRTASPRTSSARRCTRSTSSAPSRRCATRAAARRRSPRPSSSRRASSGSA